MPSFPAFDPTTGISRSPHIVILGAGASKAAFPDGDANGKCLPVMDDLIDLLGLGQSVEAAGFSKDANFESIFDELATGGRNPSLQAEIESKVRSYFEAMEIPDNPTYYDYLVLSLRENDYIATFNWDPFLALAYIRNKQVAKLPRILFLHGNVQVGICPSDHTKGFMGNCCSKCGATLHPTKLLFPVRQKNYNSGLFIASEWKELESALKSGYMLTIFGYSAPKTDVEAVDLMSHAWEKNPTFELAEVDIVDIKPEEELRKTWSQFLCRTHYGVSTNIWETWLFRHPRRSCESLAMATLQCDPWKNNPFPKMKMLSQLHDWIAPLVNEERQNHFTGRAGGQLNNPEKSL
jgi:hypothetical protein